MIDKIKISRRQFLLTSTTVGLFSLALPKEVAAQSTDDCVFCKFVANKGKFVKLWEDKNFLAFLDYRPITEGHTLLIPKQHFEYLFDLNDKLYDKMLKRAKQLSNPIKTAMNAKRIGVIVEGFGVNHVHIHLVPLKQGGELLKKGKLEVSDDEFAKTAEMIKSEIMKVKM
jgi:histidine triad (HIT) family protein